MVSHLCPGPYCHCRGCKVRGGGTRLGGACKTLGGGVGTSIILGETFTWFLGPSSKGVQGTKTEPTWSKTCSKYDCHERRCNKVRQFVIEVY